MTLESTTSRASSPRPGGHAPRVPRRRALGATAAATASLACLAGPLAACLPGQDGGGSSGSAAGGAALVFGSDGNIAVMAPDGKGRTALTKVPQGGLAKDPAWSPDGKRIAYAYTPPLANVRGPGGLLPLPVTGIYTMNPDGSDQKVVIPHTTPGVGHESPVWAPDGKSFFVTYTEIVMESNVVRDQLVEVARVTPGVEKRETLAPNGAFPTVSPDGRQLAFILTGREGAALVVSGVDGKNQRVLVPAGTLDYLAAPRFSPDGKVIAFAAAAPMPPIPTVTPISRGGASLGSLFAPRAAQAHGLPMDLFVVPAEGGQMRRLTLLGEDNPAPCWSPDGTRLGFLAGGGVYTLSMATGQLAHLDHKGGHGNIDWRRA
jgi:Tol biopolymer transport system component